ncbi:flagellar biosynthesis protein FlhB [Rhodoferax sp.]|uniref:EscU/YscU/HrcU family type III secretion system export apparatus switch protein n=1 Tax=Rhodoferax sp. TaxID=50421 RepID=UPI00274B8C07|nr:EscU/YscU/HrcU family type III secretion system export apparatus switch protein [Rhodoferax sp.]
MDSNSQDRNLPASERKLQKARDDGQVTRSRELSHLAVLGVGALSLMGLAPAMLDRLKLALSQQLAFDAAAVMQTGSLVPRLQSMVTTGLIASTVFAAIVITASVISTIAAGGWVSSIKPVTPDFSRLNPLKGIGRLFTKDKLAEIVKMVFLAAALGTIGTLYLRASLGELANLLLQPSTSALVHLAHWLSVGMGLMLLVVLLAAVVDVPLQSFLHKSRLKMSHQEVKQEHKESDGNPQMKGRLRQRQREISQGNSISAVPKADFVVMNPTHFAVAIRYDDATMRAPKVISKGADLLALKIRDMAKSHSIPVLQSPMLARALYAHSELDQDIPAELFTAVAQVLAYVYRLKAAMHGDGPMPGEVPTPLVPPELDPLSMTLAAESTA